jgi:aminomuconate-semialdehyde/2-hydroxymuconate-6-semialdehyde dehydrogenase
MSMTTQPNAQTARSAAQTLNFIGGRYLPGGGGRFENISPVDGSVVSVVHEADRADVDAAVSAARAALRGPWGTMDVSRRAELLYAVADEITRRFDDFLIAEVNDTGKPVTLASHLDIPRGAANFKTFADIVKNVPTEAFEMTTPDGARVLNYSIRRPRGVVGVISPWNLPLLLMTWKVGPALACGNAVIVKPSEETPSTATLLGEVMNAVGIPAGVYNVINGFGPASAGEFLTQHRGVDAFTFTGETSTGTAIMKAAADGVRPVSFELGGKNAALIFADCDFDAAVEGTARSAFANTGQVCLGTERVYVQRSIFDRFVDALKTRAKRFRFGAPDEAETTMGPLISLGHRDKVLSYYAQAVAAGATLITGGGIPCVAPELSGGAWIEPTIWTGLGDDSPVLREEIFGPCCHISPFDAEDEVIARANDSAYGLDATVWTRDLSRAHRVAGNLEVGVVWVNSWFLRDLRTPFGGSKRSGIGREGGVHGLDFYSELRNVCIKL